MAASPKPSLVTDASDGRPNVSPSPRQSAANSTSSTACWPEDQLLAPLSPEDGAELITLLTRLVDHHAKP
jgi:hypothetical protein